MATKEQEDAIGRKVEFLKKIRDGVIDVQEMLEYDTARRVKWMEEHKEEMLKKYEGLPPDEQAFRIICLEHMKIDPKDQKMTRITEKKIRVDSYNFCTYLEACKRLGMDTRKVCKEIGEPAIQAMLEVLNPKLRFSRNYKNIRPYCSYCEEYVEIKK
jgi:hypothetical protein